ncbi:MAG: DUF3786 domain-containing protein [Nitrospirota bacterium]
MNGLELAWNNLCNLDPHPVCKKAQVEFENDRYKVEFLKTSYLIPLIGGVRDGSNIPDIKEIRIESFPAAKVSFDLCLVLLNYLVLAKEIELANKWVSPKDLKGGEFFFSETGTHNIENPSFLEIFNKFPDKLIEVGKRLGGESVPYGDRAISFFALPRIPITYILWLGDDEFPARMTILLDSTSGIHIPLDILYALINITTKRLVEMARL